MRWTSVRTFYNGTFYGNGSGTDTNSFGTNYLTQGQGTGSAYVQFTPNVVVPGDYKVYQWHPLRNDASASVPFVINYNGGSTTVYANQQTNAGNWSLLGPFNFAAGTAGYIRVTDDIAEPGAVAIADGVKLIFVPPTSVPAAPSGLTASAVSSNQIDLAWTDNATNETAYIVASSTTAGGPYTNIAVLPLNSTSYNNTGLAPATTYYYVVWATNLLGASAASAEASATTIGIATPPSITSQPQDQNINQGRDATFTVVATGTPAPDYQWRCNGTNIGGATGTSYVLVNAQHANAGSYSVVVSNIAGTATSADALLTVNVAPEITAQPQSLSVTVGSNVTFTVTATGTLPLAYQWRFNGTNLAYATASAYICTNAQTADAGSYSVVVSNIAGKATSADAVLTVMQPAPPQIDSISLTSEGQIHLQASGIPGRYAVEAATHLADWAELAYVTNTGTTFQYLDSETNLTQRFYRLRLLP